MPGYILSKNDYIYKTPLIPKPFRGVFEMPKKVQLPPGHYQVKIGIGAGIEPITMEGMTFVQKPASKMSKIEFDKSVEIVKSAILGYHIIPDLIGGKEVYRACTIDVKPEGAEIIEIDYRNGNLFGKFPPKQKSPISENLLQYEPGKELPKELASKFATIIAFEAAEFEEDFFKGVKAINSLGITGTSLDKSLLEPWHMLNPGLG